MNTSNSSSTPTEPAASPATASAATASPDVSLQEVYSPGTSTSGETPPRPWRPMSIAWICVFFTMLPAGIMYALNFERLGQPEKKQRALFLVLSASAIFYIAQIGVFLLMAAHPQLDKMSTSVNVWFTLISIGMAWYFYLRQQPLFKARLGQDSRKASLYVPLLLSCLWMAIFAGALVGWAYLEDYRHMRSFDAAVALMEKGEYGEAESIFKAFKTRYPDDAAAPLNLTAIYLQTDRVPQARQELKALLQQDPNNEEAREILQEIEAL